MWHTVTIGIGCSIFRNALESTEDAYSTGDIIPAAAYQVCWARFLLRRSGRVEPPAGVNPQNIIPISLQTTTQNIFILWRF